MGGRRYDEIWKQSAREENMSTKVRLRHPDVNFVDGGVDGGEAGSEESEEGEEGSEEESEDSEDGDEWSEDSDEVSDDDDEASKTSGKASNGVKEGLVAGLDVFGGIALKRAATPEPPFVREDKPFSFEKLPEFVQLDILKLLLFKDGSLIHCVSRLDPYHPPPANSFFPAGEDPRRSGLRNFFFWGPGTDCVVNTGGHNPAEVLALLQVSKRMLWLGTHIFYGLNTFAFSSLGEFHRFCQGSGVARLERIQHIELCLTGNQYLTAPLYRAGRENENAALGEKKGRVPYSRRTYALSWLVDMKRLKTMVVHINESAASYMRRKTEHPAMKRLLGNKTKGQPNRRMNRALRTVQGVDYIYQLRGMEWVRWYDLHKALKSGNGIRTKVEDWSFERDIGGVVTMPKVPAREEGSRLENLRPLLRGGGGGGGDGDDGDGDDGSQGRRWEPTEEEWEVVKTCYNLKNGRCSYDELREGGGREHDADVASFALGSNRGGRRGRGGFRGRGGANLGRLGSSVTSSTLSSSTSSRSFRASALSSRASALSSRASLFGSRASSPLFVNDDDDDVIMLDGNPDDAARRAETDAALAEQLRALMDELPPPDSARGSMAPPSTITPRCSTTSAFPSSVPATAQPPQRIPSESSGLFVTPCASGSRELSAAGPGRNGSPAIKRESATPSRMGSVIRGDMAGMIIDLTRDSEDPVVQVFSEGEGVDDDSNASEDSSDDSDDDGGAPLGNLQPLPITPPSTTEGRDGMGNGQGSSRNKRGASPSGSECGASKRARSE
ncbi:hypothetical protein QBC40DRAFT_171312 [Triangularia verruculosa]|uniref:Uncharacterized protein n=1 Tax=Triangularia verruculosa TaxID=2587418 RepID=A0AAN6XJN9_9PEZI|nr:hypothetical protein QBC40DRAFT_171312 [Triangularia verruculosa]